MIMCRCADMQVCNLLQGDKAQYLSVEKKPHKKIHPTLIINAG